MNVTVTKIALAVEGDNVRLDVVPTTIALAVANGPVTVEGTYTLPLTAAASLSALRAVTTTAAGLAEYADPTTLGARSVVGVTTNAGTSLTVQFGGTLTDGSWNWSPGHVWCGANGVLTQTPPTSGAVCIVGRVVNATTILIELEPTIRRN